MVNENCCRYQYHFLCITPEDHKYANALIKNSEGHDYFAFYFTLVELFKHKERIKMFSKMSDDDILESLYAILKQIYIINDEAISVPSWKQAMNLLHDIDIKDVPNFALALELDAKLWTNDEELKRGLSQKGYHNFYTL